MHTDAENMRFMRNAYFGQSLGVVLYMLFIRSAFGTLFIKHLGGSDAIAMWVLAIAGLSPLIQIPVSLIVHPSRGKRFLLTGWAFFGVLMGIAALVPTLVANTGAALGLVVFFLVAAMVVNLAATTFWFPLLHDIIPEDFRGRFFGKLRAT
ncbi:MAG: hypothetical protein GY762_04465, partial [Proteobacteria bacterium]|nr:hypothetical protein [Pseudomonadota bacterium]